VTVIDESEVLQMTSTTPTPSLLDAAFVLAATHQADLRRQAAHHDAARRARLARPARIRRRLRGLALTTRTVAPCAAC
jgi:hypothetical protein